MGIVAPKMKIVQHSNADYVSYRWIRLCKI